MISLPIYAFFTHLVTLLTVVGIFISGKSRMFLGLAFVFSIIIISYCISLLYLSDYSVYVKIYDWVDPDAPLFDQPRPFSVEIGYLTLMYIVRGFTENFDFIRIGLIFVGLLIKVLFLMRWGKFYLISFLFYLSFIWYPDSYLLRSSFAGSLALIGFWAMLDKRPAYQFFLPIIISSTFHISALVLLPLWWLKRARVSQKLGYFILSILIIFGIFGIGHFLVELIARIFSVDLYLVDRLVNYSKNEYGQSIGLLRISVLVYILITTAYIFFRETIANRIPYYDNILVFLLFSLLLLIGLSDFEVLADRLFRLTAFFFVIAIGHIFYCLQKRDQIIFFVIILPICNLFPYLEPGAVAFL